MNPRLLNDSQTKAPEDYEYEIAILVMAKKMGMTFDELNIMSLNDFIIFSNMYTDEESHSDAKQEDIDGFYSL